MRRRKLLVALAALAVVAAGVVVLWPQPQPSSRITRENFDRIKVGMSRTEVEAILGPPGDYRTRLGETDGTDVIGSPPWQPDWVDYGPAIATWQPLVSDTGERAIPETSAGVWICDSMEITILSTDDSGRVYAAEAYARRSAGALDNLLWRFKRQWHRWFP
jgi:hypothetical protein